MGKPTSPLWLLGILLLFTNTLQGQEGSHPELCVGHYWSEEEAAEFLGEIRKQIVGLSDWETRRKSILDGIMKGGEIADLSLPRSTPAVQGGEVFILAGYQVQSLAIQTTDSTTVFGNLYQPTHTNGSVPFILCPHGHWSNNNDYGRFRADMQYRCAVLARMGAYVFAYDMIGYGESTSHSHHHPKALQMQSWNGVRLLDYFLSLPDVNPKQVAITGASGGGTQSFLLTAIDDRIKVSVPCVQVSAHFFGGCVCESGMPIHAWTGVQTNNVEIAALAAPRPMLLISNGDDWTKNTPEVEYPHIQWIYDLYDERKRVENAHFAEEVHDYGPSKRQAMYQFMLKYLNLNHEELLVEGVIQEHFVQVLSREKLSMR